MSLAAWQSFTCIAVLGACYAAPRIGVPHFALRAGSHTSGESGQLSTSELTHSKQCEAREISRKTLTLADSSQLYVEPVVVVSGASSVLLAGQPSYQWTTKAGRSHLESRNRFFGALLWLDGSIDPITWPPGFSSVAPVAATSLGTNSWAVIFAVLDSAKSSPDNQGVSSLWFGRYEAKGWTSIERLPLPTDSYPKLWQASRLVRQGQSLGWALPVDTNSESLTAFYYREGGKWSRELVPTHESTATDLGFSPSAGWIVAAVQADLSLREDENSLFFYTRSAGWSRRKVVAGLGQPVFKPMLEFSGGSGSVTWWTALRGPNGTRRFEARAMLGRIDHLNEPVQIIDSINDAGMVGFASYERRRLWLTNHSPKQPGVKPELRLIERTPEGGRIVWRNPKPFDGSFAFAVSESVIFIVAAKADSIQKNLTSRIIRLRINCKG